MTITSHLRELRKRLVYSAISVIVCFAVSYTFSEDIYNLLLLPLKEALPESQRFMAFTSVTEPFFTYLRVGLYSAIMLASPIILYQLWAFVAPGLYESERRLFLPIVALSVALFAIGVAFAYFAVFPVAFKYLLGFADAELRPFLSMGDYLSLSIKFLLAFGIVFQLPLAMLVIARIGLLDAGQMIAHWRYVLVGTLIVSAILTPPDVFSQLLMTGPMLLLYCLGVVLAKIFGKKKAVQKEAESC